MILDKDIRFNIQKTTYRDKRAQGNLFVSLTTEEVQYSSCQNSVVISCAMRTLILRYSALKFQAMARFLAAAACAACSWCKFQKPDFLPFSRGEGRLTGKRSERYLDLFEFHKCQVGRFLAFDVIIQEIQPII